MDYQHWLRQAVSQLTASESPRRDAESLLGFVTGRARTCILAFGEPEQLPAEQAQLYELLARTQRGATVGSLV